MAPIIGHGAQFELNTTGSTYVAVAGCTSGSFGSNKVDSLETTDVGTSGTAKTFTPGLEDSGDFSAKFNYLPGDTTQQNLRTFKGDGLLHNFKYIAPGATQSRLFSGFITSIDMEWPDDKLVTFTCKIKLSGVPTDTL